MVESDSWFRLRWFLVGSLAAVVTAFALKPGRTQVVELTSPTPPSVVVVPIEVKEADTEGTLAPAEPPVTLAPDESTPAPKAAEKPSPPPRDAPKPDEAPAPGEGPRDAPKPAEAEAKADTTPESKTPITAVGRALADLRASPRSGVVRARLERAIETASLGLSSPERAAVDRCVTQAGFEGNAEVAVDRLATCVGMLQRTAP